ncbi:MAG: hypothetical protein K2O09_04735, partial [Treponemataceae bacterium]|nr:hypothetical protein [Treponemataceae bacterium]
RLDIQRHFSVRQNSFWTVNGVLPVVKITSGQATAFCRSSKIRLGKQRHFAARQNSVSGLPLLISLCAFGQSVVYWGYGRTFHSEPGGRSRSRPLGLIDALQI